MYEFMYVCTYVHTNMGSHTHTYIHANVYKYTLTYSTWSNVIWDGALCFKCNKTNYACLRSAWPQCMEYKPTHSHLSHLLAEVECVAVTVTVTVAMTVPAKSSRDGCLIVFLGNEKDLKVCNEEGAAAVPVQSFA